MVVTAAGQRAQARLVDLNIIFAQQRKSYLMVPAPARIQGTRQKKNAKRLVTLRNGLVMANVTTRTTRVDATGMAGIAAAPTGISNSAHTVCAKIRIMEQFEYVIHIVSGYLGTYCLTENNL